MTKHLVLINNSHVENFSVRCLSAYLKSKGVRVTTIHCESRKEEVFTPLSEESLRALAAHCRDCDLIGITLLTTHLLNRSVQITEYLKKSVSAPIIWGGPPVMADPRYFFAFTDLLCAGEGEHLLEQLLEGRPNETINGLGYLDRKGSPVINPLSRMLDLNTLPIPRLDLEDGYLLEGSTLLPLGEHLPKSLSTYSVLLVRGCPYRCAYCLNSRLMEVFRNKGKYVRLIDVDRVIRELEWAKAHIPHLKRIIIDDDDFFLNSERRMSDFLAQYMEKINLPVFYLQANTRQISKNKLDILKKSSLQIRYLKIGLQSASERISKEIYNRNLDQKEYLKKVAMIIGAGIRVMIDIISDNPYETFRDRNEVVRFYLDLLDIGTGCRTIDLPIKMYDHKLMYFPGTRLYDMALADRHIPEDYVDRVLLRRSTLRHRREDRDSEALVVALFNIAMGRKSFHRTARTLLRLIAVRPIHRALIRFNAAEHIAGLTRLPGVKRVWNRIRVP